MENFQIDMKHLRASIFAVSVAGNDFRAFLAGKQRIKLSLQVIIVHHFKLQMVTYVTYKVNQGKKKSHWIQGHFIREPLTDSFKQYTQYIKYRRFKQMQTIIWAYLETI